MGDLTFNDKILEWVRGDLEAQHFLLMAWDAAQIWDDLEDEGKDDRTNSMISWFAFGKEFTPFFAKHAVILRPVLLSVYLQWRAANVLETGAINDIEKAYMLRAGFYGLIHITAWLVGGDTWAADVGPEIYRSYGETLDEFKEEMSNA